MANSGMIVNLVQERHFKKVLAFYTNEELMVPARVLICECFTIIAKNMGLRKLFLQRDFLNAIMLASLSVLDEVDKAQPRKILELGLVSIRLLMLLCTSRTNRFYIPGETNLAERLRKRAFDSGAYTLVTHIYKALKGCEKRPFVDVRQEIRQRVLNLIELNDLIYHAKVIEAMLLKKDSTAVIPEEQYSPVKDEAAENSEKFGEKASVSEMWKEPPQVEIPAVLLTINITDILEDVTAKADDLKNKLEKRKQHQKKIDREREEA